MFSCRISLRIYYEKILLLKSTIFRGDYRVLNITGCLGISSAIRFANSTNFGSANQMVYIDGFKEVEHWDQVINRIIL